MNQRPSFSVSRGRATVWVLCVFWVVTGLHGELNGQRIAAEDLLPSTASFSGVSGCSVRVIADAFVAQYTEEITATLKAHHIVLLPDGTFPILIFAVYQSATAVGRFGNTVPITGYSEQLTFQRAAPFSGRYLAVSTYEDSSYFVDSPPSLGASSRRGLEDMLGRFVSAYDSANRTASLPELRSGRLRGSWEGGYRCVGGGRTTWNITEGRGAALVAQESGPFGPGTVILREVGSSQLTYRTSNLGGYTIRFSADADGTILFGKIYGHPGKCDSLILTKVHASLPLQPYDSPSALRVLTSDAP